MGVSLLIARIFGPCFMIVGLGMFLNPAFFQNVMDDFVKSAALVFFGGMASLVLGFLVVLVHNVWSGWPVLITLFFGWAAIIKGIWIIVFPDSVVKLLQAYKKNKVLYMLHSVLAFVFGAVLLIVGYFVA